MAGDPIKLNEYGYVEADTEYLESLITEIKQDNPAEKALRRIYEINVMIMLDRRIEKMKGRGRLESKKRFESYPKRFWQIDTLAMAQEVASQLIRRVKEGTFDIFDDAGNRILDEKGEPKTKNLKGKFWQQNKWLISTELRKHFEHFRKALDGSIPFEKELIDFLDGKIEEIAGTNVAEQSAEEQKRLEREEKSYKKIRKGTVTKLNRMIKADLNVQHLQRQAQEKQKTPEEQMIFDQLKPGFKEVLLMCISLLPDKQRAHLGWKNAGHKQKDIAKIFGVTAAAIALSLKAARIQIDQCLAENDYDDPFEMVEG